MKTPFEIERSINRKSAEGCLRRCRRSVDCSARRQIVCRDQIRKAIGTFFEELGLSILFSVLLSETH